MLASVLPVNYPNAVVVRGADHARLSRLTCRLGKADPNVSHLE